MKLSRLLHHLRHNILNDRSHRISGSSDHLWSEQTLVDYLNEAQRQFAVRTLALRDATTPEVSQVTLVSGQRDYALHPSVIAVISARVASSQFDLTRADHTTLANMRPIDGRWFNPSAVTSLPPGPPLVFTTDENLSDTTGATWEQVSLRVFPLPSDVQAGEVLQLRTIRMPLVELTLDALDAEPEIPSINHIEMLDWAAYLALRIVDDDAGAPARAQEFKATFETTCLRARTQIMRKLYPAKGWGFGRGGFTWESAYNGW